MSTSLTLYDTESWLEAYLNSAETVTPDQVAEFEAEYAQALTVAKDKRDAVVRWLRNCESAEDAIDEEIDRLRARKTTIQNARQRLELFVMRVMNSIGLKKIEGNAHVLSIAKNPDRVVILDAGKIPTKYFNVAVKLDGETWMKLAKVLMDCGDDVLAQSILERADMTPKKDDIKRAIKAHEDVPGADIAYGTERLEFK